MILSSLSLLSIDFFFSFSGFEGFGSDGDGISLVGMVLCMCFKGFTGFQCCFEVVLVVSKKAKPCCLFPEVI